MDEEVESLLERYMLVSDSDIKALLKGDLILKVDSLVKFVEQAQASGIATEQNLKMAIDYLLASVTVIRDNLQKSMRLLPYLFVVSQLNRLGNISLKQARQLSLEVRLMMLKDQAVMEPNELATMSNFYKGLEIFCTIGFHDSVEGYKLREIMVKRKDIRWQEPEEPRKKRWFQFW